MQSTSPRTCTAFAGSRRFSAGSPQEVATAARNLLDHEPSASILVFDDATARPIEFDLRGSLEEVLARLEHDIEFESECAGRSEDSDSQEEAYSSARPKRSPGRPRLGVVGREVTLLPRHWDWLRAQPGGASVALRKLIDQARRTNLAQDRQRAAREVTYRFMSAMAGDETGFEETARALFAGDADRFGEHSGSWPADVREYAHFLAREAF